MSHALSLRSSPHTRGDVPNILRLAISAAEFSPHAWGCSVGRLVDRRNRHVLPTRVGMFRRSSPPTEPSRSSPHTRGDVPFRYCTPPYMWQFSPHAWGCSVRTEPCDGTRQVLPTCVGMFHAKGISLPGLLRSPHMRGDVPIFITKPLIENEFSPHAWGCSGLPRPERPHRAVLPTRVGMFLVALDGARPSQARSPHQHFVMALVA